MRVDEDSGSRRSAELRAVVRFQRESGGFLAGSGSEQDLVAVEEPLTLLVEAGGAASRRDHEHAVTMRTPGRDADLALGWLYADGVFDEASEVLSVRPCVREGTSGAVMRLRLVEERGYTALPRRSAASSACGVCGRTRIEEALGRVGVDSERLAPRRSVLERLVGAWDEAQAGFRHTGGLHAAARCSAEGEVLDLAEDVGRHNALDKIVGRRLREQAGGAVGEEGIVMSSRASFELVQKCVRAGYSWLACVGAPSTLAIDLAREAELTLVGFLRRERWNLYSGELS